MIIFYFCVFLSGPVFSPESSVGRVLDKAFADLAIQKDLYYFRFQDLWQNGLSPEIGAAWERKHRNPSLLFQTVRGLKIEGENKEFKTKGLYQCMGKKYSWWVRSVGCDTKKKGVFVFSVPYLKVVDQSVFVFLEAEFVSIDQNCKMLVAPEDGSTISVLAKISKFDGSMNVITDTYNFPY